MQLWWHCPKMQTFWKDILPWIKKTKLKPIPFTTLHNLFYATPSSLKSYKYRITPHLLNATKKLYTNILEIHPLPYLAGLEAGCE